PDQNTSSVTAGVTPASTTTTVVSTTIRPVTTTVVSTTIRPVTSTTTTTSGNELCDNCVDDNGNGLIDAEDPACCATPQALTVNNARFRPGKSTLRVHATLADGTFAGLDPRQQDVELQIRGDTGELVCCTIGTAHWQRLFRRTFGFFDQKMTLCPPIKCLSFALPKTGPAHVTIIAGHVKPGSPLLSPLQITLGADNQCAAGPLSLRQKANGREVFP